MISNILVRNRFLLVFDHTLFTLLHKDLPIIERTWGGGLSFISKDIILVNKCCSAHSHNVTMR